MKAQLCRESLFRTFVDIPRPLTHFDVSHKVVFLGSCFAQHVGQRFADSCLRVSVNPIGPLYNPMSIAQVLRAQDCGPVTCGPLGWHSWLSGTALTCPTESEAVVMGNNALWNLQEAVKHCDHLVITLGTNHYYRLKRTGQQVVNCHKHPSHEFTEELASVDQIVTALYSVIEWLRPYNNNYTLTLTVSPYRYAKYGFHESQLSKATLLLAVDQLQHSADVNIQYFPAYEIIVDELRDYRFYEADMLHPTDIAVDYVWQRMQESWMTPALRRYLTRYAPLHAAKQHVPFAPNSAANKAFQAKIQEQLKTLQADYPMLPLFP